MILSNIFISLLSDSKDVPMDTTNDSKPQNAADAFLQDLKLEFSDMPDFSGSRR